VAAQVEVFHWNPRRRLLKGRLARYAPRVRLTNNFGDLLGPLIVERMLERAGMNAGRACVSARLFTVGSVLHFAESGDVVWGSGVNGKIPVGEHRFDSLDVRAVRGPLTQAFLMARGIQVPDVFGDPALLLPHLLPWLVAASSEKLHEVTVVPNLNDTGRFGKSPDVLNPRSPMKNCLLRIANSRLVVGSSLHGIVVAEALGIPARLIQSRAENPFKYADYYAGTGRSEYAAATSVADARARGGEPPIVWSAEPLMSAFPFDLWEPPTASV
jgi:pyruvyltransferase